MALSDTASNPSLVVTTTDELRSIPIAALRSGERAVIGKDTYELDKGSLAPESALVVAARPAIVGTFPPVVVNPTIPGRWNLIDGGALSNGFSRTFFCDPLTAVPAADQDGSDEKPYSTISAALARAALTGGNAAIVLTAGDYLESVVVPPTAILDDVDIVGQGLESTKIIPPGGQPAFRWAPALPGGASPSKNFRINGVHLRSSDGAYALDLDGSAVTAGLFFGDVGAPVAPQASGLVLQNCAIEGVRLVKTGLVSFDTTDVMQPSDLSLTDIAIFENCALTVCDTTVFAQGSRVIVRHNDPLALKLFSVLFFSGTKVINGPIVRLEGFPNFACDPSSFLAGGLETALTADGTNPTIIYLTGTVGFIGPAALNVVFPDSDAVGAEPFLAAPGGTFLGPVTVSKAPTAVNRNEANFRGATFTANGFNNLSFTEAVDVDLTGAAYEQGALGPAPNAARVRRDRIVFPDAAVTAGGPDLFKINPPLPLGVAYSVEALPAAGNLFRLAAQAKTNTGFQLVNDSANPDFADVVVEVR